MDPLPSLTLPIIIFFVTLTFRALFSFLETSVTALRLFKLKELALTTGSYPALFRTLEHHPHRVLISIIIANNLADVIAAAVASTVMETIFKQMHFSSGFGFSVGIGLATITILIFGEIIPKNIAKGRSERLFRSTLWLTNLVFYLFYPVATFLTGIADLIMALFMGSRPSEGSGEWVSSEREIQFLIDYIHQRGLIEPEKSEMLQNIFELGRTPVREIMVPETDVVSVNINNTIQQVLVVFSEYPFTRLPVYQDKVDNVIGMVHLKDIFALLIRNQDKPLRELVRPVLFVPESVKVNQLLREFRQQHMHIAMVINEHGSLTGLITLEDVLEEIVGEISDEHERQAQSIIQLKQGGWLVDASTDLEDITELLSIAFETEDVRTLGGFLTEQLQHLPKKGERVLYKGYFFQVQKASHKRVLQVLVFEEKAGALYPNE